MSTSSSLTSLATPCDRAPDIRALPASSEDGHAMGEGTPVGGDIDLDQAALGVPALTSSEASPEEAALNAQSQVLGSLNGPERARFEARRPEVGWRLDHMADVIAAHRDEVTGSWRRKVTADVLLASSPAWSRRQFEDHIPEVIDVLGAKMRSWPDIASLHERERGTARAHSKHRWQQGYDMRSLAREWGHLNGCLLEVLDLYWIEAPSGDLQQALRVAHSLISEIILESTSESVSEYARLLQTEAAARARQMEAAIEELREEERWRGQVLREAAHDLRGSLGIVSGSASLIDRDAMAQDDRAEVGRILRRGVHSLHEMMTDLIDLARLEAGEETVAGRFFDVSQVLRALGGTALPLAQAKGLSLTLEGPDELRAWGDSVKVRRIAQNLLLNAIKYTHEGGVTLAWGADNDDRWLLRVSDTGPGLHPSLATPLAHALHEATNTSRQVEGRTEGEQNPAGIPSTWQGNDVAPTLTPASAPHADVETDGASGTHGSGEDDDGASRALVTLTTSVPGEGVGLSIVKRLCDLLGASIELDTRAGQGSAFRVLFLLAPPPSLEPSSPAEPSDSESA